MNRIDDVFSTSFDQLLENIFQSSTRTPSKSSGFSPDNIGSYIELYKEKKQLEARQQSLKKLLSEKNASILQLKQQILNHVSEKKTLNRQRESASRESKRRTHFLAKVSHELRTPVNGIAGIAGLLHDSNLNTDQHKLISLIEKSSQSLSTLIDDLLNFSKIEAGALKLEQIDFELEETIRECVDLLMFSAREKNLEFSYQLADNLPLIVSGDPLRLRQVLINLAGNAIKFTETGEVRIVAEPAGLKDGLLTIRFQVLDTGIGVPEEQHSTLFESFAQADPSITRKYGGTGLGLAISKELVHLMGGQIGIKRNEGPGSIFWFTAQVNQTGVSENLPGRNSPEKNFQMDEKRKTLRILLVEDDHITRKVSTMLLKRAGQKQVETAENGVMAIQKLQQSPFDIVIMDMQMPEMDGVEATSFIRRPDSGVLDPSIPIIAMTANTLEDDREACISAGMNSFISKPLNAEELSRAIELLTDYPDSPVADRQGQAPEMLPSVDLEKIDEMRRDIGDRFETLVQLFLKNLPDRLASIQSAAAENNLDTLKEVVHQLKGNCASFYAMRMADLCRQLEQSAAEQTLPDDNLLIRLRKEAESVVEILKTRT